MRAHYDKDSELHGVRLPVQLLVLISYADACQQTCLNAAAIREHSRDTKDKVKNLADDQGTSDVSHRTSYRFVSLLKVNSKQVELEE